MNIIKGSNLDISELLTGIFVLILVFVTVFSSRVSRLNTVFDSSSKIILSEAGDLNDLISVISQAQSDLEEDTFMWVARLEGWSRFQRGHYEIQKNEEYASFIERVGRGIQDPVDIIIPPGISPEIFARIIARSTDLDSAEVRDEFSDSIAVNRYGYDKENLFGRMLPDTYKVYWTTSTETILERLLNTFKSRVADSEIPANKNADHSLNQILIMASIVEWEANISEEKPRISGLYWNRINRGMRLQADPTVNFALGERRRLLFEDYEYDHPFNTYIYRGLPPGPITNPSISSIKAAANPEDHSFLYMVANPEGGHTFTKTFSEHRKESEKWRKWLREQYRIQRQNSADNGK